MVISHIFFNLNITKMFNVTLQALNCLISTLLVLIDKVSLGGFCPPLISS